MVTIAPLDKLIHAGPMKSAATHPHCTHMVKPGARPAGTKRVLGKEPNDGATMSVQAPHPSEAVTFYDLMMDRTSVKLSKRRVWLRSSSYCLSFDVDVLSKSPSPKGLGALPRLP